MASMVIAGLGIFGETSASEKSRVSQQYLAKDDIQIILQPYKHEITRLVRCHLETKREPTVDGSGIDDCAGALWKQSPKQVRKATDDKPTIDGSGIVDCAGALLKQSPKQVRKFLSEVAEALLREENRTASLPYIGGSLSKASRQLLRLEHVRMARVLACYADDFRINLGGGRRTVTYLHATNKAMWNMRYEVCISL
eukprot:TRINITY_DN4752_c0_g1_i4.p1 TRINITY_DN4752_c0_g1~~TRINITY_DN4752_c0_g1_i4.p1  ORF type:complete len:197 (-),score=26.54 TRINITY_DN4752_c0_g1_i4:307-897(-)